MTETDKTIVFRAAGIDIGIYNLGYCILEFHHNLTSNTTRIVPIYWGNWDIAARKPRLDVVTEEHHNEARCCATVTKSRLPGIGGGHICNNKAAFSHNLDKFYCKTHVRQVVTGATTTDSPIMMWTGPITIPTLRTACRELGVVPMPTKKEDLVRALATRYIFPSSLAKSVVKGGYITDKIAKRAKPSLDELEAGCEFFLAEHPVFMNCRGLRIENQGAALGGTTKSVQIILYTLLKSKYRAAGIDVSINCINAEDKTRDYSGNIVAVKGSKGYDARKDQAKEMIEGLLTDADEKWMKLFEANGDKADDMADAFLMAHRLGMSYVRREIVHIATPVPETPATTKRRNILPKTKTKSKKSKRIVEDDSETE